MYRIAFYCAVCVVPQRQKWTSIYLLDATPQRTIHFSRLGDLVEVAMTADEEVQRERQLGEGSVR